MSAPVKVSKKMVIDAAIGIIRNGEKLNVRKVAHYIGCSTQPIYSLFGSMANLEEAVYFEIQSIYRYKVEEYASTNNFTGYKSYGMGLIKFANEESELFKYLYMQKSNGLFDISQDINYEPIIAEISAHYDISRDLAKKFHMDMAIYSYGLAVIQSLGGNISDEEVSERLTSEFDALYRFYLWGGK
ncbi:MAG: hypothetical protein NC350_05170 [Corallococcus sp.]|nr:hypothetical protein [Corallococcus sp.]